MRKLILIAAAAFMSTTPCYANLSLASADTSPIATEQPKPRAAEARPVKPERSARISRHRQRHWAEAPFSYPPFGGYRSFGGYHSFGGGC